MSATLTLIVATERHNGIGINNTLPWRLPEDLAFSNARPLAIPS